MTDHLRPATGTPRDRRTHLRRIKRVKGKVAPQHPGQVTEETNGLAAAIAANDDVHSPKAEVVSAEVARARTVLVQPPTHLPTAAPHGQEVPCPTP